MVIGEVRLREGEKCRGLQMRCGILECLPVFQEHSVLGIGEKGVKGKRAKSLRTLKAVSSI